MLTPIARVFFSNGKQKIFYDEDLCKEFVKRNMSEKKFRVQYYKGLGSSEDGEILDIFGKRMVEYVLDDKSHETFEKAFNKTKSDKRKSWLDSYNDRKIVFPDIIKEPKESL